VIERKLQKYYIVGEVGLGGHFGGQFNLPVSRHVQMPYIFVRDDFYGFLKV
jgi:hypothetical protein